MDTVFFKTSRYKPFSYIKKVSSDSDAPNACYVGIILPLPLDYYVQRKVRIRAKEETPNKIASILIDLYVVPVPLNGHDRTKDFLWKDEFIIDAKNFSDIDIKNIDVEITVMSSDISPAISCIDPVEERNIEYAAIAPDNWNEESKEWVMDSNDWDVGSISIVDVLGTTEADSDDETNSDTETPEELIGINHRNIAGMPPDDDKNKKLGNGKPTKGSSKDKKSVRFVRRKANIR